MNRRDFIAASSVAALGASLPAPAWAANKPAELRPAGGKIIVKHKQTVPASKFLYTGGFMSEGRGHVILYVNNTIKAPNIDEPDNLVFETTIITIDRQIHPDMLGWLMAYCGVWSADKIELHAPFKAIIENKDGVTRCTTALEPNTYSYTDYMQSFMAYQTRKTATFKESEAKRNFAHHEEYVRGAITRHYHDLWKVESPSVRPLYVIQHKGSVPRIDEKWPSIVHHELAEKLINEGMLYRKMSMNTFNCLQS